LITYSTRNTTVKKNNLKDVDVVVLADGYNGLLNFALIDAYGHLHTNTYDAYGTGISSTNVTGKQGLDIFLLNPSIAVTQGTSPWVISGTVISNEDKNYGTVGTNTLRTAAQIGNATGQADFNFGISTAQTLRVSSNLSDGYGNRLQSTSGALNAYAIQGTSPWVVSGTVAATQSGVWTTGRTWTLASGTDSVTVTQGTSPWVISGTVTAAEDKNYGTVGVNTLRVASQIGNATGQADFNRGINTAQTLRTTSNLNDGYGIQIGSIADALKVNFSNTTIGVTQSTSPWVVSGTVTSNQGGTWTVTAAEDKNYGTVGANTLRVASQIGNATGAADFNRGVNTAQTLRVTNNTNDGYGIAISSTLVSSKQGLDVNIINPTVSNNDTNYGVVGSNTLRSAAQIGNATGQADFNVGTISAQTLRTASHTVDGYGNRISSVADALKVNFSNTTIGVTQSTSPWVVSGTVTANEDKNYGTVGANTLRVASQIGNAIGGADFNFGTVGAQTLRTAAELGNASGLADFNRGATGAQTLRVTNNTNDGYGTAISSTVVGGKSGLDINLINSTIAVTQSTSPWVVSGTVTSNQGGAWTVTANQGTSPWVISGTVTAAEDKNYGTVGVNTLRVASQIGNATGAADFNRGTNTAQTLRVTNNTNDGYGTQIGSVADALKVNFSNTTIGVTQSTSPWVVSGTVIANEDKNYGTVGANTLRVASQIGNATGQADFNAGNISAQTLRVVVATNQSAIPVMQSTSPWVVSGTVTANQGGAWTVTAAEDKNYGTVGANTLRVASQIGNATGAADFNRGVNSAQTLRTTTNINDGYGTQISSVATNANTRNGLDTWSIKGTLQHFNGTFPNTTPITITPTTAAVSVLIYNPGTNAFSAVVSASFDGGTNFIDIPRGGNLNVESEMNSFQVKGSATGVTYQILVTRR
jgi:hypothetical protein